MGIGESYTVQQSFNLLPAWSGKYVIVQTNSNGQAWQGPLTNNNTRSTNPVSTSPL